MLIIKLIAIVMLLFTNLMIAYAGIKYSSSGDARSSEAAKKQLTYSFIGNIISILILIMTHMYEGINFQSYSTIDWICIYSFLVTFGIFLISTLLYQVNNRFLYKKAYDKLFFKWNSIFMTISMISFLLGGLCLQLSLIFVNF